MTPKDFTHISFVVTCKRFAIILLILSLVLMLARSESTEPASPASNQSTSPNSVTSINRQDQASVTASQTTGAQQIASAEPPQSISSPDQQVTDKPSSQEDPARPASNPETTNSLQNVADEVVRCFDDSYCLNGGTCTLSKDGKMQCICPEDFYGIRCETKDICKTLIQDNLTGDQICKMLGRPCIRNDRFLRCQCSDDEYFIFKLVPHPAPHDSANSKTTVANSDSTYSVSTESQSYFDIQSTAQSIADELQGANQRKKSHHNYVAECRKIDPCLGVRCKRMSEVCEKGQCVCNIDLGYMRDVTDGLCKLLDPCTLPVPEGEEPICGQARCIATYDRELYRCFCPLGYKALKVGAHKSSTQCTLLTDDTCIIPMLNKCQHICSIDQDNNKYKCSCFPGYRPGNRIGVDDHMCFFDELEYPDHTVTDEHDQLKLFKKNESGHLYKAYVVSTPSKTPTDDKISYDEAHKVSREPSHGSSVAHAQDEKFSKGKLTELVIKRGPRVSNYVHSPKNNSRYDEDFDEYGSIQSKMNAQERCNMFCEENKICVLESGSVDSYRCLCDRQGYVSVGDSCLDWCSAAKFSYKVRRYLEHTCYSGICNSANERPNPRDVASSNNELLKLESLSSWRPSFECDCSTKPFFEKDKITGLCKLNFRAALDPCLPGNVGYEDCVINNTAYCSVLHKPLWSMFSQIPIDRSMDILLGGNIKTPSSDAIVTGPGKQGADKSYTCVCSPEKKFLVDKPREKSKCINECNLLNEECNSFNRMCRPATIGAEEFSLENLVKLSPDGSRLNIKRTGCECLPGFDVGPSESADFTMDDSFPELSQLAVPSADNFPNRPNIIDNSDASEHLRARYMNIDSRCLLDYDVVEFHASFKAPTNFDPIWIDMDNAKVIDQFAPNKQPIRSSHFDFNRDEEVHDDQRAPEVKDKKTLTDRHDIFENYLNPDNTLKIPRYMLLDTEQLQEEVVLVAQCDQTLAILSPDAYQECIRYRYWLFQKLRNHFVDWRRVLMDHLSPTFDLMDGRIKVRVNRCQATLKDGQKNRGAHMTDELIPFDPIDQKAFIDADINCVLTLHSAREDPKPKSPRKVLLEKQLVKFIFDKPKLFGDEYYLMAPDILIQRESFDQLAEHRKLFNPCKSNYNYCDKQTKCEMVDTVNFTCTCDVGYTPIGSRDIYYEDSRKETCTDIDECLFDVCKDLGNRSKCINEIGDYRCECNRHFVGDNKRYCVPVCTTIPCKHGNCRLIGDHHAFCECHEGYKEADCSVQDPNVALRKANMIICGSILTSVLLLAITFAISLNSKLRKTKKKLKRLEVAFDSARLAEFTQQQAPFRPRLSRNSNSD